MATIPNLFENHHYVHFNLIAKIRYFPLEINCQNTNKKIEIHHHDEVFNYFKT